ncbi:MAG: enoyl-CoA hydratase/isomerase family protein [Sphingobacteriaceae bacterium]|nr:enoyl-CoA hydratase/isomerase family protein [Sphingobacteriaceae bacterium]
MEYKNIIITIKDHIFYLTINRESKLNALNKDTLHEISNAIESAKNDANVRAILITGAGQKSFVAGADISEFQDFDLQGGKQLAIEGHKNVFDAIENCPKPIIAAINGFALGGGLELAMACHIRIASENAKLGLPEVTLGLIPGYGGTQRLTQLVGKGKAIEMITTAAMISAENAEKIGLVNYVTTLENLIPKAEELLNKIKQNAPIAIANAIAAVNANFDKNANGFEVEINRFADCFATQDFKEGVNAFLEKRKANFEGK